MGLNVVFIDRSRDDLLTKIDPRVISVKQLDQSGGTLAESEEIGDIWDGLVGQGLEDMDVDDAEELGDDNPSEGEDEVSNFMNIRVPFEMFFLLKKKKKKKTKIK